MKIDLHSIDREQFLIQDHVIILNGEIVSLVQPNRDDVEWTQENKIFRSSLWNCNGELVSAGFPKFTNWGECPQHFPVPQSLKGCSIVEKIDGSLLIVSKYNGQQIIRTRGTIDASILERSGHEIEIFKRNVLPRIDQYYFGEQTWNCSWLFEWTSPCQRIVLQYGDAPRWVLVGMVDHNSYKLPRQSDLDTFAAGIGFERPRVYEFESIEKLLNDVDTWKGLEGVCVYSKDGQSIHKVKSAWYLALHRMKSELSSREKVIKVWFGMGRPNHNDFYEKIGSQLDFELANQIRGDISIICDAWKEVEKILEGFKEFVNTRLLTLGNPKEPKVRGQMAKIVLSSFGQTSRAGFVFKILDGKELASDDLEKLLYQCIKNR